MVGRLVSALALVAATGSAALVAARLYIGWQLALVLAGSAAASVLLTLLLRWLRSPGGVVVLGSLAGMTAILVGLTAALRPRSQVTGSLTAVLLDAVTNSGARLMTSSIPIEPAPDTIALPLVATWLAGTGAALMLGRWSLGALAPPLALLAGSLVFVGPNAGPAYHLVGLFAVAAAAHLVVTRDGGATAAAVTALPVRARRIEASRRVGAGLAVVAVLGVLAVTLGPAAAALYRSQPYDPRALFVPPQKTSEALNPLGLLSAWATETELPLLEVTADRPVRTGWVAMSRFDGITWLPDDEFRAAGSVLPAVEPTPTRSRTVTQRITVRSLGGAWLPAAEVPRSVRGLRAGFDVGSGMLAAPDGLHDGLAYTVTSEIPVRDPNYLIGASIPAGQQYDHLLEVPGELPKGFAELAQKATGQGTPYQKALRLEKFLRTTYQFYAGAPSGHGYPNLSYFLTEPKAKGGGRGTSEQFATAFALLGRVVGLPTRVVVGFHAGKQLEKGRYLVSSGDAFAWAEVFLLGEGWVPFDPTPGRQGAQPPPEENTPEAEAESEQKEQQLTKPDPSPPPGNENPTTPPRAAARESGVPPSVLAAAALGGVLLLVLLLLPALRYRRTRSRLSRGSPPQRVVGAWAEVRDALRLAGHRPPPSRAAGELALAHSGEGLPELHPLASLVNAIGFGPGFPVAAPDADTASRDASAYVKALRRRQGLLRRTTWWLDPRPLFWRP
ncbi:MAG: DUF3488 and transglutaminase-like domain-containing protein [Micromonosporaceae bacterium]